MNDLLTTQIIFYTVSFCLILIILISVVVLHKKLKTQKKEFNQYKKQVSDNFQKVSEKINGLIVTNNQLSQNIKKIEKETHSQKIQIQDLNLTVKKINTIKTKK